MKWRRRKKHVREKNAPLVDSPSPRRPLLSSWFPKFMKSDLHLPHPGREEGGSRLVPRMAFGKGGEEFPPSVCRNCLSVIVEEEEEGVMEFNEAVSNAGRMRELERDFTGIKLNVREGEPNSRAPIEVPLQSPNRQDRESPREDRQWLRRSSRSTRRRSRLVKVWSPRPSSAAPVDIRRSKEGRCSRRRERDSSERDYEKYALVKCSYDPQEDFKESMMEMIAARGIGGPAAAEMEELLACYLILNDDAYHGVIIEVFRQVWFELDRRVFGDEESRSSR